MSLAGAAPARPPYRLGMAVALAVLAGYVLTLAPTVTFWDAGELIAAVQTLGVPHPPGTPLFVLLGHVWALVIPIGEYAARTNLLSATASAAGAGLLVLVAHEATAPLAAGLPAGPQRIVRMGGAAAAGVTGAFTFTQWQNSNETEVYAVATLLVSAVAWLALRWRHLREEERGAKLLLLIVYLFGLSVGNHLLSLLAGPAVLAALAAMLFERPLGGAEAGADTNRAEWIRVATMAGVWALLVGTGLGNLTLFVVGVGAFAASHLWARPARGGAAFSLLALGVAAAGVTTYLFLILRSRQHPVLNEAEPATWHALLDVVRRAQYPVRTPLDDPTVRHGIANPGRTLSLIWLQVQNYLQYFDWQWARSLERTLGRFPLRTCVTLLFVSLGLRGFHTQRRVDRAGWWLCLVLFGVTGLGLVGYLNFRPGASVGWDLFPSAQDHEVRERDYVFVVSFVVWGLWAGLGMAALARKAFEQRGRAGPLLGLGALSLALVPVVLNARAADRRHGADARLAADWAYDLLNTVPPYGILFTYGDNDTFPLWWAQEVAGIRPDVTVVCLALGNADWYMRQLRDQPVRPFDRGSAPALWRDSAAAAPPSRPLHALSDSVIAAARPVRLTHPVTVSFGSFARTYPGGALLFPSDLLAIDVVGQNLGRRPIVWSVTTGTRAAAFADHAVQQGIGYRLLAAPPLAPSPAPTPLGPVPLDLPVTARLVESTYRYADLFRGPGRALLDPAAADVARTLALPFAQLALVHAARGEPSPARAAARSAERLSQDPELHAMLRPLGER